MPTDASVFEAEHIAAVAAELSDSCRIRLLATLLDTDELSAERLSDAISEPVSVVGNQLAALIKFRIVRVEHTAGQNYYSLTTIGSRCRR